MLDHVLVDALTKKRTGMDALVSPPTATYCGMTNNFDRRLAQHNGRRVGGARSTRGRAWEPLCVAVGFSNRSQALSFEWCPGGDGPGRSATPVGG